MENKELKEEEFVDEDYQEITGIEESETNLITKLNSPINLILIGLILIVLSAIILILIFL